MRYDIQILSRNLEIKVIAAKVINDGGILPRICGPLFRSIVAAPCMPLLSLWLPSVNSRRLQNG